MNRITLKAFAIALPLMFGTAMADDTQTVLIGATPMNASELSKVVGTFYGFSWGDYCSFCANNAAVNQVNLSALSALVAQANNSGIMQSNN